MYQYKIVSQDVYGLTTRKASAEEINSVFDELAAEGWEFAESQRVDTNGWTGQLLFIFKKDK